MGNADDSTGLVSQLALQRARTRLLGTRDAPSEIGRYQIQRRLGEGGMGVVYAAYDPDLERPVAIKVLRSETHTNPAWLLREAQALARLSHPNVVQVYEVAKHEDHVYLAMELVEGRTLAAWVKQDHPPVREIVRRYIEAAQGLKAAHAANVLHRDFKPDNTLMGSDGRVRVLDFGLARRDGDEAVPLTASGRWPSQLSGNERLTASGTVMGTPRYMPPEQHAGAALSPAADQYAFCASLWTAIAGSPAFAGEDIDALAAAKMDGPPAWPKHVRAPPQVVAAIVRGLSPRIRDRWPAMHDLIAELETGISNRRRNRIAATTGVFALAGLGVAALALQGENDACEPATERLGDAWSPARRDAAAQSFDEATLPYASTTWASVEPMLESYAAAWSTQYIDNCEATLVRKEQPAGLMDVRAACLLAAHRELDATTRVLATGDPAAIQRADSMVRALPRLARCADSETLLTGVAPPPEAIVAAVEQTRDELATGAALMRAGKYDEAEKAYAAPVERADALGYEPLQAEAQLRLGWLRDRQGRLPEAETAQATALRIGLRTGQWALAVQAATALVIVVGLHIEEPERGISFATTAWGLLPRTGEPLRFEAELRRCLGAVHRGTSEFDRAEEELREGLAIAMRDPEGDRLTVMKLRNSLGLALMQGGKFDEAEKELRAALATEIELRGAEHPSVAGSHQNLGALLLQDGRYSEAENEYKLAISLQTAALGDSHPSLGGSRGNLASVYVLTGRFEEAEVEGRAALKIAVATRPPGHTARIVARANLASYIGELDRRQEAAAEFRKVIAELEAAGSPDDPMVGSAQLGLAIQESKSNNHDAALKAAQAGLAIYKKVYNDAHPRLAEARGEVAGALLDLGRAKEAIPFAEAAWAIHEQGDGFTERRANTGFVYARAIHQTGGKLARARSVAETARDFLDDTSDQRRRIIDWLSTLPLTPSG